MTDHNSAGARYWAAIAKNSFYGLPYQYSPQNDFTDGSYYFDLPPL